MKKWGSNPGTVSTGRGALSLTYKGKTKSHPSESRNRLSKLFMEGRFPWRIRGVLSDGGKISFGSSSV